MILYGKQIGELNKSFLIKKFQENSNFWDFKLYSDFLTKKDYLSLLSAVIKNQNIIFYSLESSSNKWKYKKPFNCKLRISHRGDKSLYFNLLANEYLSGFFKEFDITDKKSENSVFISSNFNKVAKFFENKILHNKVIDFYGLYGKNVPEETNDYYLNAQLLFSKFKSVICLENSNEYGYIQGSYIPALLAKSVPIINVDTKILNNILNPKTYITLNQYVNSDLYQINNLIQEKYEYIMTHEINNYFSNLFKEYLTFLEELNIDRLDYAIKVSQNFKHKIFNF